MKRGRLKLSIATSVEDFEKSFANLSHTPYVLNKDAFKNLQRLCALEFEEKVSILLQYPDSKSIINALSYDQDEVIKTKACLLNSSLDFIYNGDCSYYPSFLIKCILNNRRLTKDHIIYLDQCHRRNLGKYSSDYSYDNDSHDHYHSFQIIICHFAKNNINMIPKDLLIRYSQSADSRVRELIYALLKHSFPIEMKSTIKEMQRLYNLRYIKLSQNEIKTYMKDPRAIIRQSVAANLSLDKKTKEHILRSNNRILLKGFASSPKLKTSYIKKLLKLSDKDIYNRVLSNLPKSNKSEALLDYAYHLFKNAKRNSRRRQFNDDVLELLCKNENFSEDNLQDLYLYLVQDGSIKYKYEYFIQINKTPSNIISHIVNEHTTGENHLREIMRHPNISAEDFSFCFYNRLPIMLEKRKGYSYNDYFLIELSKSAKCSYKILWAIAAAPEAKKYFEEYYDGDDVWYEHYRDFLMAIKKHPNNKSAASASLDMIKELSQEESKDIVI